MQSSAAEAGLWVSVRGHPFVAAHLVEHRLGSPHDRGGGREASPGARVASRRDEEGLRSRCALVVGFCGQD